MFKTIYSIKNKATTSPITGTLERFFPPSYTSTFLNSIARSRLVSSSRRRRADCPRESLFTAHSRRVCVCMGEGLWRGTRAKGSLKNGFPRRIILSQPPPTRLLRRVFTPASVGEYKSQLFSHLIPGNERRVREDAVSREREKRRLG